MSKDDVMNLQRFNLKIFADVEAGFELTDAIAVFHSWIQSKAIEGLMIDVADYTHMERGPGVMLVGHESHLAFGPGDDGRLSLEYRRMRPEEGDLPERIRKVARRLLAAASGLEDAFAGKLRFRLDDLQLSANDRLRAPSGPETYDSLEAAVAPTLEALWQSEWTAAREADPRELATLDFHSGASPALSEATARL